MQRTPAGWWRGEPLAHYMTESMRVTDDCQLWPYAWNKNRQGSLYGVLWIVDKVRRVHSLACEDRWGPMPAPRMHATHGRERRHPFHSMRFRPTRPEREASHAHDNLCQRDVADHARTMGHVSFCPRYVLRPQVAHNQTYRARGGYLVFRAVRRVRARQDRWRVPHDRG